MLPLMAALVMMTTAGAALAVDVTRAYSIRVQLQSAADAAALAAAIKLPDRKAARAAASHYAAVNLPNYPNILQAEDFEFGNWDAVNQRIDGAQNSASAVRLTVRLSAQRGNGLDTLFAGVFGGGVVDVEASAVAGKQGVTCMIALDADKKGIEIKGNAKLDLIGCGAQSNSTDTESLKVDGKMVRMTTEGICVSGRAKIDGNADVVPAPIEFCPLHEDPLSWFIAPEFGGCTDNDVEYRDVAVTLTPGRVFCDGLKLSGKARVTLQPGLYVIDNGKLEVDDESVLEGDGVTILLHGEKAEFDIKKKGAVFLTAPLSGDLQGLLIVQDEGGNKDNKWDSKASSALTGVVYLPDGKFTSLIAANITGTNACFVLIANQIKMEGKSRISIDLTGTGCRQTLPTSFSRSVALLA